MTINSNIAPDRIISNADLAELHSIREFVLKKAVDFGFSDDCAYKLSMAVDEACSNLIRHAYKLDATKEFAVEVSLIDSIFQIKIFDWGEPFNPMNREMLNMEEYLKLFKRGGLGIHIIRKIMDIVEYFPSKDKLEPNILILKKQININ